MKTNGLHKTDAALDQEGGAPIEIPPLGLNWLQVEVRGLRPLIVHKFSEKARKQMEQKQQKQATKKRDARVPMDEAKGALYLLCKDGKPIEPHKYGFPAAGFKKAMVSACRHVEGVPMTVARGAFHVYGDGQDEERRDLVILRTPGWKMRSDVVRLESGVASIAYRPEFDEWSAKLRIRYVASSIAPAQLVHMLNVAGFTVGIGENRAERSGDTFGQFEVVTEGGN